MDQLLTGNVWKQVKKHARECKRRMAAIAYVTDSANLDFKKGDVLVCNASSGAIKSGQTSAKLLDKWHKRGVQIYSHSALHSKVLVLGSKTVIGSSNLSKSSADWLREASIFTSQVSLVSQARAFIHMAQEEAELLDNEQIINLCKLVVKSPTVSKHGLKRRSKKLGSTIWLVAMHDRDERRYLDEEQTTERIKHKLAEQENIEEDSFTDLRFTGKTTFNRDAIAGDSIIALHSTNNGKRIEVYPPRAILYRQKTAKWTRFYYNCESDLEPIAWTDFQRYATKYHIKISKNSIRALKVQEAFLLGSIWSS